MLREYDETHVRIPSRSTKSKLPHIEASYEKDQSLGLARIRILRIVGLDPNQLNWCIEGKTGGRIGKAGSSEFLLPSKKQTTMLSHKNSKVAQTTRGSTYARREMAIPQSKKLRSSILKTWRPSKQFLRIRVHTKPDESVLERLVKEDNQTISNTLWRLDIPDHHLLHQGTADGSWVAPFDAGKRT